MRIAYICTAKIPSCRAAGINVMNMCESFADNGHNLRLYVPNWQETPVFTDNIYDWYGTKEQFEIQRHPYVRFRGRSILFATDCVCSAKRWGAELVYGRDIISLFGASLAGLPSIFEAHWPPKEMAMIEQFCLARWFRNRHSRHIVVISHALADLFVDAGFPPSRLKVAADAVNHAQFMDGKKTEPQGTGRLRVGYAGSMARGRGIDLLLQVARKCPEIDFILAGGSQDERRDLPSQASANIEFTGFLPPRDVPAFLKSCMVLVAPYQHNVCAAEGKRNTCRWMSPIKLFEYMAAGRPVLVSDLPVLHEIMTREEAVFITPDCVDNWVAALRSLQNPKLRAKLGACAQKRVMRDYTWQDRARAVLQEPGVSDSDDKKRTEG